MLRSHGAAGTGRSIACIIALMLGATSAHAQSAMRQAPLPNSLVQEAQATAQPAPARFFRINDVLSKIGTGHQPDDNNAIRLAARDSSDVLSDTPLRGSLPQIGEEPFGLFAFHAPEGSLWRKWRGVEADIVIDERLISLCRDHSDVCTPAAKRFLSILDAAKARSGRSQLEEVNRQINAAIRYVSDMAQHSVPDRWSAPLTTLAAGRGDCEDYAIAKYVILREAGYPAADLRFLLVRDRFAREDHAVLAARLDGRWLILDNRFNVIPEDTRMHNFTPLFALNHEGVKLVAAPYAKRAPLADEPKPAALFEGDFSLRGTLATDTDPAKTQSDQAAGASDWIVTPLLM